MTLQVRTLSSPVYELLLSISLYKRQTLMKYLDLGAKWPKDIELFISPELHYLIASKENMFFEDLLVLLIEQSRYKDKIDLFFEWLGNLSGGELFERIAPLLDVDRTLPSDLASQRDRSLTLLKAWNEQYFQLLDCDISDRLNRDAKEKEHKLKNQSQEDVILEASRYIIETPSVKSVCLIPAIHLQPMSFIDHLKDTLYITYPIKDAKDELTEVLRLTKALGDEKRLKIMKFLSHEPTTFTNIVSEFGMAKGNIHHHLSILRGAGLLNIHVRDKRNTFYYSTNIEIAEELRKKVDQFLK
ncbi:ArsR/SmtB family transcription factor [Pseudalkalibacillus sp. NRS-1564]|uniref:ArsR/SmtB family transcription factor n=1 Tax=Pseudalkalibacillus sp. NRS-1564 TaxID=3233900 RepID=UPI003D28BCA7